jgi:hypothetical protein
MRQRRNPVIPSSSEEDESASGSDGENNIQTSHPDDPLVLEHEKKAAGIMKRLHIENSFTVLNFFRHLGDGKCWWAQILTIYLSAALTYSYNHNTNVQLAIMTVITMVGASPFCSTHLIPASIGAFVGGHNIIGSIGDIGENKEIYALNYIWLLLLTSVVGLLWCFFITQQQILDGYAGRLGTTTFIGMNLTMLLFYGPLNIVEWNRYYYGFNHLIHIAEEDSVLPDRTLARAWSWTEETELAVGYIFAVLWLGAVGGGIRIFNQNHVERWHRDNNGATGNSASSHPVSPPTPLNNVLSPVLLALSSMLVVNTSQYKHAFGVYNGFAVGSYVAMASLQKIPSTAKFAIVSLLAAGWGLALTPVFVGFAGKSGFTSMLGHLTYTFLESYLQRARRKMQERHRMVEPEGKQLIQEPIEHETKQASPISPIQQKKYVKPRHDTVFATKQQRRQKQRLQNRQNDTNNEVNKLPQVQTQKLHHRAWQAVPGDGAWQHPLETSNSHQDLQGMV